MIIKPAEIEIAIFQAISKSSNCGRVMAKVLPLLSFLELQGFCTNIVYQFFYTM